MSMILLITNERVAGVNVGNRATSFSIDRHSSLKSLLKKAITLGSIVKSERAVRKYENTKADVSVTTEGKLRTVSITIFLIE